MKAQLTSKYAVVKLSNGSWYINTLDEKSLRHAYFNILLEEARIDVDDATIDVRGTQIFAVSNIYRTWTLREAINHKLLYKPEDIQTTLILRRKVLKKGYYEKEVKKDYSMVSNMKWSLTFSNGEVLSSEELA